MKEHTKSLGNDMPKLVKYIYYTIVLFGNVFINKIPSRHIRKWFYQLMGAKIGKNSFPCRRVEVLLPKGLQLEMEQLLQLVQLLQRIFLLMKYGEEFLLNLLEKDRIT